MKTLATFALTLLVSIHASAASISAAEIDPTQTLLNVKLTSTCFNSRFTVKAESICGYSYPVQCNASVIEDKTDAECGKRFVDREVSFPLFAYNLDVMLKPTTVLNLTSEQTRVAVQMPEAKPTDIQEIKGKWARAIYDALDVEAGDWDRNNLKSDVAVKGLGDLNCYRAEVPDVGVKTKCYFDSNQSSRDTYNALNVPEKTDKTRNGEERKTKTVGPLTCTKIRSWPSQTKCVIKPLNELEFD